MVLSKRKGTPAGLDQSTEAIQWSQRSTMARCERVVRGESNDGTDREAGRKLQNVPNRRAAESVQALVLVADNANVAGLLGELEQELLLDEVRVLVLVHQ